MEREMPAKANGKGEIGEAMVIADLMRQGHDIAIPFGHNQDYAILKGDPQGGSGAESRLPLAPTPE